MRERFIQAGPRGLRLCLCEWGPEDPGAPLAVILHGFADQGAAWGGVAEHLAAADWRVVAPDQRGFGRSDHVGPGGYYHFPDYVRDLDAVLEDLGATPGGFTLVGHSMGATVASLYAGLRPEMPARLVLIDGLGVPDSDPPDSLQRFRRHLDQMRDPAPHRVMADLDVAAGRLRRFSPGLSRARARALAERVARPLDPDDPSAGLIWRMDPLHRTRAPVGFSAARYLHVLSQIQAPVTIAWASVSPFQPPDLEARRAAIRDLQERTLQGGHNLHFDAPETVARVILGADLPGGL